MVQVVAGSVDPGGSGPRCQGPWGGGHSGPNMGLGRPFLGRGVGASLGVEVQVDVEVGVEEGVEEEEVVVEVVQVVTSPSWPSSWARGEGGWRRWRGRWTGVATPFLLLEVLLSPSSVVRCSILRHVFLMLTAHTIINTVTGKIHHKIY